MNVFAKFDEIPSMLLQDIKETKRYGHTFVRLFEQRENSIPSHKQFVGGINKSGLIQMIRMGKSICHKWVSLFHCLDSRISSF